VILTNSWSASALEVGHRRCSRKLPPARNSKHVHTGLDEVHQNVPVHSPPYFQLILDVPTCPVLPHSSGRCWDVRNTQTQRRGQPPQPRNLKSEQPYYLSVDADGSPSWVDQISFVVTEDDAGTMVVVLRGGLLPGTLYC
jgi:hypothetical protein